MAGSLMIVIGVVMLVTLFVPRVRVLIDVFYLVFLMVVAITAICIGSYYLVMQ